MNTSSTLNRGNRASRGSRSPVKPNSFFSFLNPLPQNLTTRHLEWLDPFEVFQKLSFQNPLVFLDAASTARNLPRSLIAWDPYCWVRGRRESLLVRTHAGKKWKVLNRKAPHTAFQELYQYLCRKMPKKEALGAYGVFHYEAGEYFERLPEFKGDRDYFEFIFPKQILVFDHEKKKVIWHSLSRLGEAKKPLPAWFQSPGHSREESRISCLKPQFSQPQFESIVKRAKEYICAGDIYQANLSQDFSFRFQGDPVFLYGKLRRVNPSPFSSFIRMDNTHVISSSPELLVRKEGRDCFTRPIAGTRPRGSDRRRDTKLSRSLLLSPKERAEHLMLLDLERNDLGRVCRFGSVEVEEQMVLERYSHVIHIVSQVRGKMLPDKDAFDLVRALFPGGTITGCPKIRSMEIIHELEKKPRQFYTGSLGFLGFSGEAVFNIIIRTIVLKGRQGSLRVGAGIVADSNPSREYWETIQKGKAMFEALGVKLRGKS